MSIYIYITYSWLSVIYTYGFQSPLGMWGANCNQIFFCKNFDHKQNTNTQDKERETNEQRNRQPGKNESI